MRFSGNDGREIKSVEDWEEIGKPADAKHWKDGRSAKELAKDWLADAEGAVLALLETQPELAGASLERGIAEKKTQFDENPRGPRNHDLLIEGRLADGGRLVVAVEGKADEPFDKTLGEKYDAAAPVSGQPVRIDGLTQSITGSTLERSPELRELRYQLFSAMGGLMADAQELGADRAVLLVMEYQTPETRPERLRSNGADLASFVQALGGTVPREESWVTPDGGLEVLGSDVPVHVAKLVRRT